MRIRAKGINTVRAQLASGEVAAYYYHRATGKRLVGKPGIVRISYQFYSGRAVAATTARRHTVWSNS